MASEILRGLSVEEAERRIKAAIDRDDHPFCGRMIVAMMPSNVEPEFLAVRCDGEFFGIDENGKCHPGELAETRCDA